MENKKTNQGNMSKKLIAILIVVVIAIAAIAGYNKFFGPEGTEGSKEVTIVVKVESEDIDYTEDFKTDKEFLLELLEENDDKLEVELLDSDFGPMLIGLKGYSADQTSEYFHITINGIDAEVGVKEIPLQDKDTYMFEIKGF
ncbi:MAG: hypothetical protein GX752_00515 [Clostridium sp.]|nr:hypothetical protein [Clostridium sp.]